MGDDDVQRATPFVVPPDQILIVVNGGAHPKPRQADLSIDLCSSNKISAWPVAAPDRASMTCFYIKVLSSPSFTDRSGPNTKRHRPTSLLIPFLAPAPDQSTPHGVPESGLRCKPPLPA